jgi:polysaccharide pyruvyl transferase WcaK-like protein
MFATLRAIAAHANRIFTYPFSVSSGVTRVGTKAGIKADLGKIQAPLIARDGMSRQVLERLGLTATQGVDCVFSLYEVARTIPPHPDRDPSRILLVVTKQETAEVADKLRSLAGQVNPITVLTTCAIEDEPVLKAAAEAAGVPYLAPMTWQETIAEMKSSALVISNRLHGLIFASLAEVPVLPLTNRSKVAGVAKDAELDLCAAEWSDLDAGIIREALSQGPAIAAKFGRYRDRAMGSYYRPMGPRAIRETAEKP